LKVDRTHTNELHLLEDEVEYTMHELRQLLNMVNQGNQAMGGGSLKKVVAILLKCEIQAQ
tara:strand:+ start:1970 stop:2149 length:180 start_codon:yes stop_codon:yes gene_type:complete